MDQCPHCNHTLESENVGAPLRQEVRLSRMRQIFLVLFVTLGTLTIIVLNDRTICLEDKARRLDWAVLHTLHSAN